MIKQIIKKPSLNIRQQMITRFIICAVLPITIINLLLIYSTYDRLMKHTDTQISSDNKTTRNILLNVTSVVASISNLIADDSSLSYLVKNDFNSPSEVYDAYRNCTILDNTNVNYVEISYLHVFTDNPSIMSNKYISDLSSLDIQEWYQNINYKVGEYIWFSNNEISNDASLYLLRHITYPRSTHHAVLLIGVSNNYLHSMCENQYQSTYISLVNDKIFFSTDHHYLNQILTLSNIKKTRKYSCYHALLDNKKVLANHSTLKASNSINLFHITTISHDSQYMIHIIYIIALMILCSLILPLILFIRYSNSLNERLLTVRKAMHKIANGEYDISPVSLGNDELGQLFEDIYTTMSGIQILHQHILQEQAEKNQIEILQHQTQFQLLASQINPHFLFNTLESIRMQALIHGDTELNTVIMKLGKIMRYSLETSSREVSSETTLSTELEYIKAYLEIQHFRFRDKLNYKIYLSPQLVPEQTSILPLILQPIVENSVQHGYATKKQGGTIQISINIRNENLVILISDNGCGMSENKMNLISEKLEDTTLIKESSHIGIQNVNQRIKLYYGTTYGIKLTSKEQEGTTVTIEIPYKEIS